MRERIPSHAFYWPVAARTRRRAALAAVAIALAALVAVDIAILLHPEQLRRRLAAYTARFVRGEVELEGVRFSLLGSGRVARATIRPGGEARRAGDATSLRIEGLTLHNAPLDLLRGEYRVVRIEVDAMEARLDDPVRFLETFRRLAEMETGAGAAAGGAPASIAIERLAIDPGPREIPLAPAGRREPIELRRVRIDPDPAAPGRLWRLAATYEAGPFEDCALVGRIDLAAALIELDIEASNVDVSGRSLAGMPEGLVRAVAALRPRGPVDLHLRVSVPWRRLAGTSVSGEIDCYSVSVGPRGFARPFTNISGRLRFEGPRLWIEELRGLYGTNEVRFTGRVGDVARPAQVDIAFTAPRFDLGDLRTAPLPEPLATSVEALAARGEADLHMTVATVGDGGIESARFRAQADFRGAELAGLIARAAGELAVEGRFGAGEATGSLRLERAEVAGIEFEDVLTRVSLDGERAALERAEGQAAGGRFWARLERGVGRPRFEIAGEGREVELAPILGALYRRPLSFEGKASGSVSIVREPGAAHAAVKVDIELGPAEMGPIPALEPIWRALAEVAGGPDRPGAASGDGETDAEDATIECRRGRFVFNRAADGNGHALLSIRCEGASLAAEGRVAPDWRVAGEARLGAEGGKAVTYVVEGPIGLLEFRPGTAR